MVGRLRLRWLVAGLVLIVALAGGCGSGGGGGKKKRGLPRVRIEAADPDGGEGAPADAAAFRLSRTGSTAAALPVRLSFGGSVSTAAGEDLVEAPLPATVEIPAGAASVEVAVTPIDDGAVEEEEVLTVAVEASAGVYRIGSPREVGLRVADDDGFLLDVDADQAFALVTSLSGDPGFGVLDVRTEAEFAAGHIEGATNLDARAADFADRLAELGRTRTWLLHCKSGGRSAGAFTLMVEQGFLAIYHLTSGLDGWIAAGYPVVTD